MYVPGTGGIEVTADFQDSLRGGECRHRRQRREFPLRWPGSSQNPDFIHLQGCCNVHLGIQGQHSDCHHLCIALCSYLLSIQLSHFIHIRTTLQSKQKEAQRLSKQLKVT